MTGARDWFVPLAGDSGRLLLAFPHAGAGCAQLAGFARSAARQGISVWSANLPGRQARLTEPPRTDFRDVVEELTDALTELVDNREYAMFGYCAGALLAFGVLRRLAATSAPLPEQLVVASYDAPDIARRPRRVAGLPSDVLWTYLLGSGGAPASLGADARLRRVAEPAIRADFAVLAGYRHEPCPPLPVPITVCFGEQDTETARGALLGWRRQSTFPVRLHGIDADHWLLDNACDELAEVVANAMAETPAAR